MPGLGLGRDPERSPMRRTTQANAGFCPPDSKPWLPVGDTPPVEAHLDDGESMLTLTRRLLWLRRRRPELATGTTGWVYFHRPRTPPWGPSAHSCLKGQDR